MRNNNLAVARQIHKAEKVADRLADIVAIKAAIEAKAVQDEYHRRMEAWNPAVGFVDAYHGWLYQSGYGSDDGSSTLHTGLYGAVHNEPGTFV
jgi:hypothetical protein